MDPGSDCNLFIFWLQVHGRLCFPRLSLNPVSGLELILECIQCFFVIRIPLAWIGFVLAAQVIACKTMFLKRGGGRFIIISNQ